MFMSYGLVYPRIGSTDVLLGQWHAAISCKSPDRVSLS
jgi:hypothetical protein